MATFRFNLLHRSWPELMLTKNWLWVWNADKTPPHIGISVGRTYHSLTFRKNESILTKSMVQKAKRSGIPLLLIGIENDWIREEPSLVFSKFLHAKVGGPTCLTPIKMTLGYDEDIVQLANLLEVLSTEKGKLEVFAIHLSADYTQLPDYSVAEIMQKIKDLNEFKG